MNRLRKLGLVAALIMPLAGTLALGAGPASAATAGCQPATPAPSSSYPGTNVVAANFESGTLDPPFVATAKGTGTASVSTAQAHTGTCAAYLHATSDAGSVADISTPLPAGSTEVYADGWFDITTAGLSGTDVPYFRIFSGTTAVADVYRYNSNGQLWLRTTSAAGSQVYTRLTSSSVPLGSWHHVVAHVVPNAGTTTVEVWFDGARLYSSSQVSSTATTVSAVQLGDEHDRQMGDTYIDDLVVNAAAPAPTTPGTCQPSQPAPSDSYPGTVAAATGFESNTFAPFTAKTAGTGTATVSSALAHTGGCAAYLHATTDAGSLAYCTLPVPAGTKSVYADGWFNITTAGVSGNDVPYFRFFSGTTRIADIYRYNSNGQLWLRVTSPTGAFTYTRLTSSSIPLSSWHHVVMHLVPNGSATTVQVWFDGAQVYSSSAVSDIASSVSTVQLGAEHDRQMGESYIDDVVIKAAAS